MSEVTDCNLCGSGSFQVILSDHDRRFSTSGERFDLVKCKRCGLLYLSPRPLEHSMSRFYPKEYSETSSLGTITESVYHSLIAERVSHLATKRVGRLLDIGCGDGRLLERFRRYGWEVYGLDTNPFAVELARARLPHSRILNHTLKDCHFESSYFDVVVLRHTLEHLHTPLEQLQEAGRILKDRGTMAIVVPNARSIWFLLLKQNWYHLDLPRHLYHFNPRTLRLLLSEAGFQFVCKGVSFEDPLDWFRSLLRALRLEYRSPTRISSIFAGFLALISLPLSTLLSILGFGSVIENYYRPSITEIGALKPKPIHQMHMEK